MKKFVCLLLAAAMICLCGCNIYEGEDAFQDHMESLWDDAKDHLAKEASNAWEDVKEEAANQASEAWDNFKEDAANQASEAWEDLKDEAGKKASEAWDDLTGKDTEPTETTGDPSAVAATLTSEIAEKVDDVFQNLPGMMIDFWSALFSGDNVDDFDIRDYPADTELSGWDSFWSGLFNIDGRVYYHPNGGTNGPKAGYYTPGKTFKTTTTIPLRTGYHFMGWAQNRPDANSIYQPGEISNGINDSETHLFAVWASDAQRRNYYETYQSDVHFASELWASHDVSVSEDGNHMIVLRCSCGADITDRSLTKDQFSAFYANDPHKTFEALSEADQEKVTRLYAMYLAQEYAPAILYFSAYACDNTSALYDGHEATFDILGAVAKLKGISEKYEDMHLESHDAIDDFLLYAPKYAGAVVDATNILKISAYTYANMDKLVSGTEVAPTAQNLAESTLDFLNFMESATSFLPIGFYYSKNIDVLKEGIKLWQQCEEQRLNLYDTMDVALQGSSTLKKILGGSYVQILDESRNNIYSAKASSFEIIDRMYALGMDKNFNIKGMSDQDARLLSAYLANRLEYEFELITGITLEEYISYVTN